MSEQGTHSVGARDGHLARGPGDGVLGLQAAAAGRGALAGARARARKEPRRSARQVVDGLDLAVGAGALHARAPDQHTVHARPLPGRDVARAVVKPHGACGVEPRQLQRQLVRLVRGLAHNRAAVPRPAPRRRRRLHLLKRHHRLEQVRDAEKLQAVQRVLAVGVGENVPVEGMEKWEY